MPHSPIILSSGHETLMKETKYRVSLLRKVLRALKLLKLKTSTQLEVSLSKDQVITNYFLSADIVLDNVFVSANNRLENALDFATGANNILKHSRIYIAWVAAGCAAGAIEAALKYTL